MVKLAGSNPTERSSGEQQAAGGIHRRGRPLLRLLALQAAVCLEPAGEALVLGAISGVLAGYLVLSTSHIDSVVPVGHFAWTARIPAWLFIGAWFLCQLTTGLAAFGDAGAGIAHSAHVGGFITGLLLVRPFSEPDRVARLLSRERRSGWA